MAKWVSELRHRIAPPMRACGEANRTSQNESPVSDLVTLFRGLVSTIRTLATRLRSINGGWRLRGWVALVAYDGNGVIAQIYEQLLRLLLG